MQVTPGAAGLGEVDPGPSSRIGRGVGRRLATSRVVAGIALALTWLYLLPTEPKVAASGVDLSWFAGLSMVAHGGLQQGTEVVYTYGPLGFLATSVYAYTGPWLLATAVTWCLAIALPLVVYWLLRVSLGAGLAGVATALLVPFVFLFTRITVPSVWSLTAGLLGLGLIVRSQEPRPWMVVAFGAAISAFVLVSPVAATGAGIALFAASTLPALETRGRHAAARGLATFAASFGAGFVVLWFSTGQSLGNLVPWIRYSANVVSGYAAAMQTSDGDFRVAQIVAALAIVLGTLAAIWWGTAEVSRPRRLRALGVYLVLAFLFFKHGFVRQDEGHVLGFFEYTALAPLAFLPWIKVRRTSGLVAASLIAILGIFLTIVPPFAGWSSIREGAEAMRKNYRPASHIEALTDTVELAVSAEERSKTARRGMTNVVRTSKFPEGWISNFQGRSVHISPWDASLEYGLQGTTWRPAPVFQDYAVYTTALDQLNADWFEGPAAADVVLRRPGRAIDGRMPRWEPPTATIAMLCRYQPESDPFEGWLVMRRLDSSRCGALEVTGSTTVSMGEALRPPTAQPGSILVARFSGIADAPIDRLMTTVFKGPDIQVETADGRSWRFLPGTQGSWHVLSAPDCARVVLDGGTRPDTSSMRFWSKGGPGSGLADALSSDTIEVEFASMSFTC